MKRLLLFIVITAMGMGKGLSQSLIQTYTDRCTGQTYVFSVPMNGQTVVAFYNRSQVFTAADFANGTLQAWLEETYLWWTSLSPCSTATTGATATQQTTQQTTQQATQAATNAAASAPPPPPPPATTNTTTNAPSTSTNTNATTGTSQGTTENTNTANTTGGTQNEPTGGADTSSTGTNGSGSSTAETGSTETQGGTTESGSTSSETDQSTGSTEGNTTEGQSETGTEETTGEVKTEETKTEETKTEESKTEESKTEESSEESKTEESSEESTEESSEESTEESSDEESSEESDESSEEDKEEESKEEESDDEESEESEEEDSEEESNDEESEEGNKKKKKKRNLAPPVVMANMLAQQMPTGEYVRAAMFGISQTSLLGTETYGVNLMVYDNLQQFMLTGNYSKVHFKTPKISKIVHENHEHYADGKSVDTQDPITPPQPRVNRVYSASLGGMKMFSTYMGMMNHSMVWLGLKGSATGLAFGTSITSLEMNIRGGNVYYDDLIVGTSLTGFWTKPFMYSPKLTVAPMVAVSSPFLSISMFGQDKVTWSKDVMIIGGPNFTYKLTQRFGFSAGVTVIESTIKDFPTLKTFMIGGRLSF